MARLPEAEPLFPVAERFRQNCLLDGRSLLWPERQVWIRSNIEMALNSLQGVTGEGFLGKWRQQLEGQQEDVHRVAADVTAIYLLCPVNVTEGNKLEQVRQVISWNLGSDEPDYSFLSNAFQTGFANPGRMYFVGRGAQMAFFLAFSRELQSGKADARSAQSCKSLADAVSATIKNSKPGRHVLLYLLFPEKFERIVSHRDKEKLLTVFREIAGGATDLDDALFNIHEQLNARYGKEIDFYDKEIRDLWKPEEEPADGETPPAQARRVQYWVEKTIVQGRPDRQSGEYRLGLALWSPQKDKRGADIYRFMRDVQPGDVILHLTDNRGFTGISRASGAVRDLNGVPVPNTEWGTGPSYLVPLQDFATLDPPLDRAVFFGSPYRERLIELLKAGRRYMFYNDEPSLNQGAYLTPVPAELLRILDDAYKQVSGRTLSSFYSDVPIEKPINDEPGLVTRLTQLIELTHLEPEELLELETLLLQKRQVILEGPPGSGKTFVAEKFGRYVAGDHLDDRTAERVTIVQFHQSYSYEDFVQGIRPITRGQVLEYQVRPGIFMRICSAAASRIDHRYVIIIDEINRGNISRIFGELLFLLEYRGKATVLPYAEAGDSPFAIPPNVYLIGTMNTTDRSLAQIDYALRRRFYFFRLLPVVGDRAPVLEKWLRKQHFPTTAEQRVLRYFIALNHRVQRELGEHFQVGHSYFMSMDLATPEGLDRVWRRAVRPLLEEYFYNRRGRETLIGDLEPERLLGSSAEQSAASSGG